MTQLLVHIWHFPQLSRGLSIYINRVKGIIAKKAPIGQRYRQKNRSTKADAMSTSTSRTNPGRRLLSTKASAGAAPTVNSIPKASHGLNAETDNEPASQPNKRSEISTIYFISFKTESVFADILILDLVHREKIRNIQSVMKPKAHIQPQKKRPAKMVRGMMATSARISGHMADRENDNVTIELKSS